MCRRRFTDEQIIGILKEAEAGGKTTTVIFKGRGRGMESDGGARARKHPGWRTPLAVSLSQDS